MSYLTVLSDTFRRQIDVYTWIFNELFMNQWSRMGRFRCIELIENRAEWMEWRRREEEKQHSDLFPGLTHTHTITDWSCSARIIDHPTYCHLSHFSRVGQWGKPAPIRHNQTPTIDILVTLISGFLVREIPQGRGSCLGWEGGGCLVRAGRG